MIALISGLIASARLIAASTSSGGIDLSVGYEFGLGSGVERLKRRCLT